MSKESAQRKIEGLQQAVSSTVDRIETKVFRPLQKSAFLCSAKCCDTTTSQTELQNCCGACERGVQQAQALVNREVSSFQERLQRCTMRCQDSAQEQLSPGANEKQVAKAEASLWQCYIACTDEYSGKVPKLEKDLMGQLSQFK